MKFIAGLVLGIIGSWLVAAHALPWVLTAAGRAAQAAPDSVPAHVTNDTTQPRASAPRDVIQAVGVVSRELGADTGLALSDVVIQDWNRKFEKVRGRSLSCTFDVEDVRVVDRSAEGRVRLCVLFNYADIFEHFHNLVQCRITVAGPQGCRPLGFDADLLVGVLHTVSEVDSMRFAALKGKTVSCRGVFTSMMVRKTPAFSIAASVSDYEWDVVLESLEIEALAGVRRSDGRRTGSPDSKAIPAESPTSSICSPCGGSGWNNGPCGLCNGSGRR